MSEFIIIQVGQCGNQIGRCLLPEILQEYDVRISGNVGTKHKRDRADLQQFMSSFFNCRNSKSGVYDTLSDLTKNNVKARFLCIDMEDSVVARCKTGVFKDLYDRKCLITNYPGSGNNWAEGYCSHGPKYKQKILKSIQYTVEQCDNLHGFLLLFSVGGGTGSGLGSFILKLLADHYPKIERFVVCVYPIGTEDVITCPYNMGFATQELLNNATCVFPVENRALLDITFKQTPYNGGNYTPVSLYKPFEDLNSIIVDMILHLTSGSRFGGKMNIDINEINTNMVPFPEFNFLTSGFSPFSLKFSNLNGSNRKHLKNEVFFSACSRTNQLIKVDPLDPRYTSMSVSLLGRGNYSVNDMRNYVEKLKSKMHFPPWSEKAVKIGLCNVPPKGLEFSMFSLYNTTSISNLFQEVLTQFMKLYNKKAHTHHYTTIPGFEYDCFQNCQEYLNNILHFYKDIEIIKPVL